MAPVLCQVWMVLVAELTASRESRLLKILPALHLLLRIFHRARSPSLINFGDLAPIRRMADTMMGCVCLSSSPVSVQV